MLEIVISTYLTKIAKDTKNRTCTVTFLYCKPGTPNKTPNFVMAIVNTTAMCQHFFITSLDLLYYTA